MAIDTKALRAENQALRALVASQAETIAKLSEMVEKLHDTIANLNATIAKLNERITELTAIARKGRRAKPVTPPPKPPEAPLELTPEASEAFANRPTPPVIPPKPEKEPKEQRRPGRNPVPSHLEVEPSESRPVCCGGCGSDQLEHANKVVERKLHVVKEHQRCREVVRFTMRCKVCRTHTTGDAPPAPFPKSSITCEWLAWLVKEKFAMLTPLDRIRRDLEERNVPVAMGSLVRFIEKASDLLAPIDGFHWQQLLASRWMATDGTGIKVLIEDLPHAYDGYIELYRNASCAVFQYEPTKDGDQVAAKLKPFVGTLTSDAESRFNGVFTTGRVIEAGCNAHGRRKFRDAESAQPALAAEGGAFLTAWYVHENQAHEEGLTGAALLERRQARIGPIANDFKAWLELTAPTLLPSDPLRKAIQYYLNHWLSLTRFLHDPDVPIDNSATEREFQNFAKLRLNMLFAGSTEGAHRACVLLGIIATCKALGVPVAEYLAWAFERLGTHRATFGMPIRELTPAAFKTSRG